MAKTARPWKKFTYRHESWDEDEFWVLRSERGDKDNEAIEDMMVELIVSEDITPAAIRAAAQNGDDPQQFITDHISQKTRMTARVATMIQMSHHWTLRVDPDLTRPVARMKDGSDPYTDETGVIPKDNALVETDEDGNDVEEPHPLAGQPMPLTAGWIGLFPPDVAADAWRRMNNVWLAAGRTEKQEVQFPSADLRESEDGKQGPKGPEKPKTRSSSRTQ